MRQLLIIISFSVSLGTSCGNFSQDQTFKPHDQLIDWSTEIVMEDGEHADGYYNNHLDFIKPHFSTEYQRNTLTVTTLIEINSCAETVPDIRISNDTLYLLTRQISDEACASVTFNKFTYVIHNPENKRFTIESEK
ncbi:MAG: hypothetical protein HWE14_13470 [Flavobacteriia bacterium]|nr:hypothetical protein [Flavobacteriia bacterium]